LLFPHADIKAVAALEKEPVPALLKLAALIHDASYLHTVSARLKLSNRQTTALQLWLSAAPGMRATMDEAAQKKMIRCLKEENYRHSVLLAAALSGGDFSPLLLHAGWQPPEFPVGAKDLLERGFKEGKELGDILRALESEWEESGYGLDRQALL